MMAGINQPLQYDMAIVLWRGVSYDEEVSHSLLPPFFVRREIWWTFLGSLWHLPQYSITDFSIWGRRNFIALTGLNLVVFLVLSCRDLPQNIFSMSHRVPWLNTGHQEYGLWKRGGTELLHIAAQLNSKPSEGLGHMVYFFPLLYKRLTWPHLHRGCLTVLAEGRCPRHCCHSSIHHLGPFESQ